MQSSERETRVKLIDQRLRFSGWDVNYPAQVIQEFDILTQLPDNITEPRTSNEEHQYDLKRMLL